MWMNSHFLRQLVVPGTNSTATETPNLGLSEEGNLIQFKQLRCDTAWLRNSSVVLQLNYGAARLWGSSALLHLLLYASLCLAPVCPTVLALLWQDCFPMGSAVFCFQCKGKVCSLSLGKLTYRDQCPTPDLWLVCPVQMRTRNPHSSFGSHCPDWL